MRVWVFQSVSTTVYTVSGATRLACVAFLRSERDLNMADFMHIMGFVWIFWKLWVGLERGVMYHVQQVPGMATLSYISFAAQGVDEETRPGGSLGVASKHYRKVAQKRLENDYRQMIHRRIKRKKKACHTFLKRATWV